MGGKTSLDMAKVLAKKGVHVTYGGMGKEAVAVGTGSLIFHDITLKGFWLSQWVKDSTVEERAAMLGARGPRGGRQAAHVDSDI